MDGIRITLDPPYNHSNIKAHVFTPGSIVSGKVILTLSVDERIEAVNVEFKGKSHTTRNRRRDNHVHEIVFFHKRVVLFKGPFKMRADKYEYPFSFTFPETWNHPTMEFKKDGIFAGVGDGIGDLPLPPSCEVEDHQPNGDIYYRVTASVPRTFADWESKATLIFSPYRLEISPDPEPKIARSPGHNHRDFHLSHEGESRELSKKELVKHGFHRSLDTHTINYTFTATAPSRILLGQAYPILLTMVTEDDLEGIEPDVMLKDFELLLKLRTDVRFPGTWDDHIDFFDSTLALSRGHIGALLPVNRSKRLTGMFPMGTRFGALPPSFTSLAVKRSYGLELKLVLESSGGGGTVRISWPHVELLSQKVEVALEDAVRDIESGVEQMIVEVGVLPAYVEHAGSTSLQRADEGLPGYQSSLKS